MKYIKLNLLILVLSFFVLFSCKEDEVIEPEEKELTETEKQNLKINDWIIYGMETYYLWENQLPDNLEPHTGDPEEYFNSLLFDEDKWSYIVDDYEEYFAEFEGTPTSMGYSPQFWLYNNSANVMAVIQYIYPGSPADEAGLKRGDIILQINNKSLTPDNYYDLYSGKNYSVQLASWNGRTLNMTGESIFLTAEVIDANPSIFHHVYDLSGIKTGYLVYTGFVAGNEDYYLDKLSEVFQEFKNEGVSEVIIDLRYNRGGDMQAARHLASIIAPKERAENEDVLIRYLYNDLLTSDFSRDPERSISRFKKGLVNMELDNVYFMVTSSTASASEVVLTGLEPYMNTTIIGTNTSGKYTGMFVLDHLNDNERFSWGKHNWGMIPITFKYANAVGYTNFKDGIEPHYIVEDDLLEAVPFGDETDPMLAKAFELISGQVTTASLKSKAVDYGFTRLDDERFSMLNNLIITDDKLK
ncbi:MAG: S41 family peptidase [Prolixibacteraceae bacterium]|jgi:carboxyl-terminal processing protease|nr:S41 family peptidase [Prolixibacteraceae bacterium]